MQKHGEGGASQESRSQSAPERIEAQAQQTLATEEEQLRYLSAAPGVKGVKIHIQGSPGKAYIRCTPPSQSARRNMDDLHFSAGANCAAWRVEFKDGANPLTPAGPYGPGGPTGGLATGALGAYPYTVYATDRRDGAELELDPDVVIMPGFF